MMKKFVLTLIATAFVTGFTAVSALDMKSWGQEVMKKVARYQKYPPAAINRELEGRAKIRVTVSADGTITNSEIIEETDHKILNREIPKILKSINPLPALPDGRTELTFTLPLVWVLR